MPGSCDARMCVLPFLLPSALAGAGGHGGVGWVPTEHRRHALYLMSDVTLGVMMWSTSISIVADIAGECGRLSWAVFTTSSHMPCYRDVGRRACMRDVYMTPLLVRVSNDS